MALALILACHVIQALGVLFLCVCAFLSTRRQSWYWNNLLQDRTKRPARNTTVPVAQWPEDDLAGEETDPVIGSSKTPN